MLRCCAGICGGSNNTAATVAKAKAEAAAAAAKSKRPEILRPILPIGEPEAPAVSSLENLASTLDFVLAPPGAERPLAVASRDFPRNVARLLVLVPAPGTPAGGWDPAAGEVRGSAVPLLRWAQSNGYAACVFDAAALAEDPVNGWDRVLRGSPASTVVVIAADGALPTLGTAMAPMHELLFARFRSVCVPFPSSGETIPSSWSALPAKLRGHLEVATMAAEDGWAVSEPSVVLMRLFELLAVREERWQRGEARKYAGFQNLKENDMPGLKRLGLNERVQRLDRDRGNDELAQLIKKNEHAEDSGSEPGVD